MKEIKQFISNNSDRILTEFQIILGLSIEDTQKKLDKALKRNLEAQHPKRVLKAETTPAKNLEEAVE